jgi:hypothetical protein
MATRCCSPPDIRAGRDRSRPPMPTSSRSRRPRPGLSQAVRYGGTGAITLSRAVHRITPAGRAEPDRWLSEPNVRTRGYRDDFFLKVVAVAQAGDPETLAAVLRRQRVHLLTELRSGDPGYPVQLGIGCGGGIRPLPAEAVEFPVPDAAEKGVPLIRREPQDRPCGIPAVTNADLAPGQARYLDAVAVGVAQRALDPVRTRTRPFASAAERSASHVSPSFDGVLS